jgi:hypothetical protein
MGQSNDYYNPFTEQTTSTPFAGGSYNIIGGKNNSGNGNVNTTSTVTLNSGQLPSHSHFVPQQDAYIYPTSGNKYIDTGHTHVINEGKISVSSTDSGHTHNIKDPGHYHGCNGVVTNTKVPFSGVSDGSTVCLTSNLLSDKNITYDGSVQTGEATDSNSTGITTTETGYANNITSTATVTTGSFTNATGNAKFSGTAKVVGVNSGFTGGINENSNQPIDIPITPSFIMNYLIKL